MIPIKSIGSNGGSPLSVDLSEYRTSDHSDGSSDGMMPNSGSGSGASGTVGDRVQRACRAPAHQAGAADLQHLHLIAFWWAEMRGSSLLE